MDENQIKHDLWQKAEIRGEQLFDRLGAWLDTDDSFDDVNDNIKYAYIMTALGKSKPKQKQKKEKIQKEGEQQHEPQPTDFKVKAALKPRAKKQATLVH